MAKPKIVRAATVAGSLDTFCNGLLKELSDEYEVVALASDDVDPDNGRSVLASISEREGVRTVDVAMNRRLSPVKDLGSLWRLYRVFRRERPAMVHSMTPKAGLLCMMAAWMARVPVRVHTFTGLVFPTARGAMKTLLMTTDRITCACATHVVPEGRGVLNDLANNRITRKPMKVLGHGNVRGIDLRRYDPADPDVIAAAQQLRDDSLFTFVFIGRLVGDKGINELVEAFDRLHRMRPATRLMLIGSEEPEIDPLAPVTRRTIADNDAILAPGHCGDVRPYLAAADCAILPSYREGFPNVVIEAGAMGLPQIVTDINGSREIIIEGQNGIIVAPRSATALFDAMLRLVDNPDLTRDMAARARPLIASRFEQGYVRRCLRDFYREILPPDNHA